MKEITNVETKTYEAMVSVRIDIVETDEGFQAWGYMDELPDDGKELLFTAGKETMTYMEFQSYVETNLPFCVSLFSHDCLDDEYDDFEDDLD